MTKVWAENWWNWYAGRHKSCHATCNLSDSYKPTSAKRLSYYYFFFHPYWELFLSTFFCFLEIIPQIPWNRSPVELSPQLSFPEVSSEKRCTFLSKRASFCLLINLSNTEEVEQTVNRTLLKSWWFPQTEVSSYLLRHSFWALGVNR